MPASQAKRGKPLSTTVGRTASAPILSGGLHRKSKLSRLLASGSSHLRWIFRGEPNEAKPSKQTQRSYFRTRASRVALFLAPMWEVYRDL